MAVSFRSKPEPTIKIFCDFDGTIFHEDVGDAFFEHVIGDEYRLLQRRFFERQLSPVQFFEACAQRMVIQNRKILYQFLDGFEVDSSFVPFVRWVSSNGYSFVVVSDGLDFYVNYLLMKLGIDVPVRVNRLHIDRNGSCSIELPHYHESSVRSGVSKHGIIANESDERDVRVLIGDGISDFEAAHFVEVVFAKGELEKYCQCENISYRTYANFYDVRLVIENLLARRKLRPSKSVQQYAQHFWQGEW